MEHGRVLRENRKDRSVSNGNTISYPEVLSPEAMKVFSGIKQIGEASLLGSCTECLFSFNASKLFIGFVWVIGDCFLRVKYGFISFLMNWLFFFSLDLPAMDNSVFLELFGLDRNLPLYYYLCFPWSWLSSIYLYSYIQTSTTRHSTAHSDSRSAGVPKGEYFYIGRGKCLLRFNS